MPDPVITVVGGICRFTVLGHWSSSRKVANILDMHIDVSGILTTRTEAIEDQAQIISDQWVAHILPKVSSAYTMEGVRFLDFNTEDGVTGINTDASGTGGGDGAEVSSANVAQLIHKVTTSARGHRNGRLYIVGCAEASVSQNGVNTTNWGTRWNDFLGDINQNAGEEVPVYDSHLVVLHLDTPAEEGGIRGGSFHNVESMTVDPLVATQRRRLRS